MWALSTRGRRPKSAAAALAERPELAVDGDVAGLSAEIERLTARNRASPSAEQERMLLHLRNLKGIMLLEEEPPDTGFAEPDFEALPPEGELPEVAPTDLTPGLLRAGILRDGCVLVRGLVPRRSAIAFAKQIERSFVERERYDADDSFNDRLYLPFEHDPRYGLRLPRDWIKAGGGVLAVDSPRLSFQMSELFESVGLPQLIEGYLQAPPLVSADKTTLRKAEPTVSGGWHQDGKFMGEVKAINLWLSLSRCGEDAPGLDLVPRRLENHVETETDEAMMANQVSQATAVRTAGERAILRPTFQPGDALLFDELFLHKTASEPTMRHPRYAIENWFFAAAGFPANYTPLSA